MFFIYKKSSKDQKTEKTQPNIISLKNLPPFIGEKYLTPFLLETNFTYQNINKKVMMR